MRKLLATGLVLVLVMPALVAAQPGPHGSGMGCPWHQSMCKKGAGPGHHGDGLGVGMLLKMGDEINLTDKQRENLEKMQVEFQMQRIDHKAEVEKAELRLRTLMHDEDAAEGEVLRGIDEVTRLKAEMQKKRYMHRKQIRQLLTDEQFDKLKELRKKRMEQSPMGMKKRTMGHGKMQKHGD